MCVDARLYRAGGMGTFLQNILPFLSKQPHLDLALLCFPGDRKDLGKFTDSLIEMKSPIYSLKEQKELAAKIPRCDLFWSPHFNVPLFPIKAKKRMTTIHDVFHLAFFSSLNFREKLYAKWFYNAAFALSDWVTAPSIFTKNEIDQYATIRPKRISVLPNPVSISVEERGEGEDFLLCVGNVKPHKNFTRLVKAYRIVAPQERLVVVGKREGLRTIDHEVRDLVENDPFLQKQVTFTGWVDQETLESYYRRAKVFLFPSLYEGFGYPPLEAMGKRCPVVAARAGAIPEVCGEGVLYVDPLSVDSIAEGIGKLLGSEEEREALIGRGDRHLSELLSSDRLQPYLEVIDACCSSA